MPTEGFVFHRKDWNLAEFRRIRNTPALDGRLHNLGQKTVEECNSDLHAAQAKRNEPVEDGYTYQITHGTRARLYIYPFTARAEAHEARNQSILKHLAMYEITDARIPDQDIPAELARRVRRYKTAARRKARRWLKAEAAHHRAEALHRAANRSIEERQAIAREINEKNRGRDWNA